MFTASPFRFLQLTNPTKFYQKFRKKPASYTLPDHRLDKKDLKIENRSEDFPLYSGKEMVRDEGCPYPDPICAAKGHGETEPGHQEIECQQEHHGGDHKPEGRDDQLLGRLPPCLGPGEDERECRNHRRRCQYAAIPGIHMLGEHGHPDNDTSADNKFQEGIEVVHRVEYFPRRLNTLSWFALWSWQNLLSSS